MEQVERLQLYFQILSDVNRLRIIKFISNEERTVSEIVKATNMSQPLVSHHSKILKNNNILETKRVGPFIHYKLKNIKLFEILGLFEDWVCQVQEEIDKYRKKITMQVKRKLHNT